MRIGRDREEESAKFAGGEARKGVSGADACFMGYYTIWLAPVKSFLVPFWEFGEGKG